MRHTLSYSQVKLSSFGKTPIHAPTDYDFIPRICQGGPLPLQKCLPSTKARIGHSSQYRDGHHTLEIAVACCFGNYSWCSVNITVYNPTCPSFPFTVSKLQALALLEEAPVPASNFFCSSIQLRGPSNFFCSPKTPSRASQQIFSSALQLWQLFS